MNHIFEAQIICKINYVKYGKEKEAINMDSVVNIQFQTGN